MSSRGSSPSKSSRVRVGSSIKSANAAGGATLSSRRGTTATKSSAVDDEWHDVGEDEDRPLSNKRKQPGGKVYTARPTRTTTTTLKPNWTPVWFVLGLFKGILSPFIYYTLVTVGPVAITGLALYWGVYWVGSSLASSSMSLVAGTGTVLLTAASSSASLLTSAYCSTVRLGCADVALSRKHVSTVARKTTVQAEQALTVFHALQQVGGQDSAALRLHPVEVWELGYAVQHSTAIPDREFIASQLAVLGHKIRDTKDAITEVVSLGYSTFTWMLHDFARLQDVITRAHLATTSPSGLAASRKPTPSASELDRQLDKFFDGVSAQCGDLIVKLDAAIREATSASEAARPISGAFRAGEQELVEVRRELGWSRYLVGTADNWKKQRLTDDLALLQESTETISHVWTQLEDARNQVKAYRNHVQHLKAGLVGFHLSGVDLSIEDEVRALASVMTQFHVALDDARNGRHGSRSAAASARAHKPAPADNLQVDQTGP